MQGDRFHRKVRASFLIMPLVFTLAGRGTPAAAAGAEEELTGQVELLYRSVSTDGSRNKFQEDFDGLEDGVRLGRLRLDWRSIDAGVLDHASIDLRGLGGEPFESSYARMGRKDVYDLRISHRKQSYVYDLFSPAGSSFQVTDDLDGHMWNTDRRLTQIHLDLYLTENFTLLLDMHENRRSGRSLFMKDIQRDLFRLETPIDRTERRYAVGARYTWDRTRLEITQTLRRYDNNFVNSTLNDAGLDGSDAAFLNSYSWVQADDGSADYTRVSLQSSLGNRVNLAFSYHGTLLDDEEVETSVIQDADGVGFNGQPFTIAGGLAHVKMTSDTHVLDLDAAVQLARPLILHLGFRHYDREMVGEGEIDLSATGSPTPVSTQFDHEYQTTTALFELRPHQAVTLRAGARLVDRSLTREGFDPLDPSDPREADFDSSGDETALLGFSWRIAQRVRLSADYEDGEVERPFTVVSPFETEHLRARVAITPDDGMRIDLSYVDFKNTQDALASQHVSAGETWSASFWHQTGPRFEYQLGYSEQALDAMTRIVFDAAGFGAIEDGTTRFDDTNTFLHARFVVHFTDLWEGVLRYVDAEARGINPFLGDVSGLISLGRLDQDYEEWEAGLTRTFSSGLYVGGSLRRVDYSDASPAAGYDGSILTFRAGVRF